MEDKAKIERCKYSHPHFKNNSIEYHCVVGGRNKKESEKAMSLS